MYGLRHRGFARKRSYAATSVNSQGTNAGGNCQGSNAGGNCQGSNAGGNSQRTSVDGGNSQRTIAGGNSQGSNANCGTANSQSAGDDRINTEMSNGGSNALNDGGSGTAQVMDQPPTKVRGRGKKFDAIESASTWWEGYAEACRPTLFKVTRADVRQADRSLEAYLAKRVSDLMYQSRLDAVKIHENCDDNLARTIDLTEEQYINSKLSWCPSDAWIFLSKYWTSEEYKTKRKATQASRLKSRDVAQNRGGSRPWGETQQLLEYKFGPEKAGTLNTYAVMKSGFKKVDSTGKSAPIPSQKAHDRYDQYNARTQLHENSKELDVHALYFMERGMAHGRVPITDGFVDKQTLAATGKFNGFCSRNTGAYQAVVHENEQLKERNDALNETNKKLNENNEILAEENCVNCEMMMVIIIPLYVLISIICIDLMFLHIKFQRIFEDLKKQPPANLMNRLANIDARRQQVSTSSHFSSNPLEMLTYGNYVDTDVDDDDYNDEMNDSNTYDGDNHGCDDFDEDDSEDICGSADADMNSVNEEDSINGEDDSDENEEDITDD